MITRSKQVGGGELRGFVRAAVGKGVDMDAISVERVRGDVANGRREHGLLVSFGSKGEVSKGRCDQHDRGVRKYTGIPSSVLGDVSQGSSRPGEKQQQTGQKSCMLFIFSRNRTEWDRWYGLSDPYARGVAIKALICETVDVLRHE